MNSRIAFLFSTLVIFLITASISASNDGGNETDYQALLQFKSMIMNEEGNLSFLRDLYLKNNSFQGTIPHELGRLSRLRFLQLVYNKLKGVIPTNLSGCSNLEELGLYANKLFMIIT
ncbi:hypothetical protein Lser_V15G08879 [Lactuca serriola]